MKHFLLLVMVFVGSAHCASQIEKLKSENCTEADKFLEMSCQLFDKSCTQLTACLRTLQCGPENPERKRKLKLIRNYCDGIVYVTQNFTECDKKLESKNSTCYSAWDPFPENFEEELDEKKKKEMLQENCKDYFGKDNCMKKEITETCGEDEWVKFRAQFIGVGNVLSDCDLKKALKDNLKDFLAKIDEVDAKNKNDLNKFDKSCTQFTPCLRTLQCGPEHPARKQKLNLIRTYCDSIVFISNNFTDCDAKLERKNSTCYTDWDPFPENYEEELDEKKKKEMLQEKCKDYFGKDNCMKMEITETCGEAEWVKFRAHFIGVGNVISDCDLKKALKDI
nr:RecName: Full=UPF0376 protein C17B7.2 [Caenorhabditis elegans]